MVARAWACGISPARRGLLLVWCCALALGSTLVAPPDAEGLVKPNVVLIMTDDQPLSSLAKMPYVNGRTDWIRFDTAYLNVALCCPTRASTLSGQYSHHTGVETNTGKPFRDEQTIATWLRAAGYRTGYVGKYMNEYPFDRGATYIPPGWDDWQAFTEVGYYHYTLNENRALRTYGSASSDYSTDVLAAKAVEFIKASSSPFFLQFMPYAPHVTRAIAPRHVGRFANEPVQLPPNFSEADVSDKPAWVRALPPMSADAKTRTHREIWETMLAVDEAVAKIDEALTAKGVRNNTIVIFMTDNGYALGSHRWNQKKCPYEECIRTPLLVRYPGQPGRTVSEVVSNVDIAPTLAAVAGTTPGIPQDGRSLVPLIENQSTAWRSGVLLRYIGDSDVPAFWGIRTARYKYLELATGEHELYDMLLDPYELQNVAGQIAYQTIQADHARQLEALKAS
jgi:arylsulfatase A-like enzyme